MTLEATATMRKMRGGAQSYLIAASDGRFYVVKFQNNPQHRRILINELMCCELLAQLGVEAAPGSPVMVTPEFCARFPDTSLEFGGAKHAPKPVPGWHFGSLFPGDPERVPVYDYLPDKLLMEMPDREVFAAAFVFDKWIGNADSRQTIFFRPRGVEPMRCWLIDHGYAFNGPYWELLDNTVHGLYFRPLVYSQWRGLQDLEPWLSQIAGLPPAVIDRALRRLPGSWFDGDEGDFEQLLSRLYARRRRLEMLIEETVTARPALFPKWKG